MPGRQDPRYSRPPGSFHASDEVSQVREEMTPMSPFKPGVRLRPTQATTWPEGLAWCGHQSLGRRPDPYTPFVRPGGGRRDP